MARYPFNLPDIGEGVVEAEIVAWHVEAGQQVEEDQRLVDVMTDKATVEMTAPVTGTILVRQGEVGEMIAVGALLVEIATEGETTATAEAPAKPPAPKPAAPEASAPEASAPAPAQVEPPKQKPAPARAAEAVARVADAPPLASPATRQRAYERGIPLQFVPGSGPGGRITPEDLDDYIASGGRAPTGSGGGNGLPAPRTGVHESKLIGMRRKIAERMQEAKRRIPHFAYVEELDLTELESLRGALNADRREGQPKLTLLPFFMRAVALLQPEFPNINSRYDDEAGVLSTHDGVHIGIATQTGNGLMVPVVRHVEALDLWQCASAMRDVTQKARDGKASREELSGSTITLTSLGTLGGIVTTPVINAPEVAILGPNKLIERPVVRNGQITVRNMMNLSSSFDHRIVDGHDAARYVQRLKGLLEHPARLFIPA